MLFSEGAVVLTWDQLVYILLLTTLSNITPYSAMTAILVGHVQIFGNAFQSGCIGGKLLRLHRIVSPNRCLVKRQSHSYVFIVTTVYLSYGC